MFRAKPVRVGSLRLVGEPVQLPAYKMLDTAHCTPERAAQYTRVPCTSCIEVMLALVEKFIMKLPSPARMTTKKIAVGMAKPLHRLRADDRLVTTGFMAGFTGSC